MQWKTSYILVRPDLAGALQVVHTAEKLKDARYWLQYIAQPNDSIFTTPLHAKYQGSGDPGYMAHLVSRGKIEYSEPMWKQSAFAGGAPAKFDFVEPPPPTAPGRNNSNGAAPETQIMQFVDGRPHPLSLEQLGALLAANTKKLEVVLSDPSKWIDWESALTLMTREMFVIGVDKGSQWPLTVTLKPKEGNGQTMQYEPEMKFIVRPRTF